MSAERDELRELVEQLPEQDVPAALADVRRHGRPAGERRWPPAFFGAGRVERSDVAARTREAGAQVESLFLMAVADGDFELVDLTT